MEVLKCAYFEDNREVEGEIVKKYFVDFQVMKEDELLGGTFPFGGVKEFETEAEAKEFANSILGAE